METICCARLYGAVSKTEIKEIKWISPCAEGQTHSPALERQASSTEHQPSN